MRSKKIQQNEDTLIHQAHLLDEVSDAIIATDMDFSITYWNKPAEYTYGWTSQQALGKKVDILLQTRYINISQEEAAHHLKTKKTSEVEVVHTHKTGRKINVIAKVSLAFDKNGTPTGTVGVLRDITERKQAEEFLRESEEKYHSLYDSIDEGFAIIEMIFDELDRPIDFCLLDVNHAFEVQTGLANVTGRYMRDIAPSHEQYWFDRFGQIALTGEPVRFQSQAEALGRYYDVYAFRVGKPEQRRVALLFNDITARKQAEEFLKRNSEAMERSIEMKDEFLSLISHEFRTPLTVIISAIQMLKVFSWNELSDKSKGYFNTIRQNANRQLKLVNNILDITKVNAGSFDVHTTNSDIVALTKLIMESIGPYADRKKIKLSLSFSPAKIIIGIDVEKYERILLNLLSNAIKYTPKGESVSVKLNRKIVRKMPMACIQVCDSGIGIPEDRQSHIFERFGQVDSVLCRQAEGTGIGLHLTRMFVDMLGGEISIKSKLGAGSTFTVLIPAVKVKETSSDQIASEISDSRTIQLTEIEFSDIYLDK